MEILRDDNFLCEEVELEVLPQKMNEVIEVSSEGDFSLQVSSEYDTDSDQISCTFILPNDSRQIRELNDFPELDCVNELEELHEDNQDSDDNDNDDQSNIFVYSINSEGMINKVFLRKSKYGVHEPVDKQMDDLVSNESGAHKKKKQKNGNCSDDDANKQLSKKININKQFDFDNKSSEISDGIIDDNEMCDDQSQVLDEDCRITDSDDEILNTNFRRKKRISISSSSDLSLNSEKSCKSNFKTKGNAIRNLKKSLQDVCFKFHKNNDYWEEFKKNPSQILRHLKHLKKKSDYLKEGDKKIIEDLKLYADTLYLDKNCIISYSERVTRTKFKQENKLNEQLVREELFENYSQQKKSKDNLK